MLVGSSVGEGGALREVGGGVGIVIAWRSDEGDGGGAWRVG
jgi:hypothetical protein